jgi:hypothetical protein
LPAVPPLPRGHPETLLERNRDLPIDGETCESGLGQPVDLADAVDALLAVASAGSSTSAP